MKLKTAIGWFPNSKVWEERNWSQRHYIYSLDLILINWLTLGNPFLHLKSRDDIPLLATSQ